MKLVSACSVKEYGVTLISGGVFISGEVWMIPKVSFCHISNFVFVVSWGKINFPMKLLPMT
jgi:hypothetical protein